MKKQMIQLGKCVLVFIMLLGLSGCWNRRELNSLAIVLGIAIDKAETANEIELTAQIVKTGNIQSSSNKKGGDSEAFFNLSNTGENIISILRDDTHEISRKLYIPHNQVIIFSEEIAKAGIRDYVDLFLRDHEARMNVYVLIGKNKAKDSLNVRPRFSKTAAADISQVIEAQGATSETAVITMLDLMNGLASKTNCVVAPFIEVKGEEEDKTISISGGAIIKEDKLVGELSPLETRGYLWAVGKVKSGMISVHVKDATAQLEIVSASGKMTPNIDKDGKITFTITIEEAGTLASQQGSDNLSKVDNIKLVEAEAEKTIKEEVQKTIDKAKEFGTDIFGFGESIHKKYPGKWKTLEPEWDKLFKEVEVEIDVTAKVRGSGRIAKPDYPEKE